MKSKIIFRNLGLCIVIAFIIVNLGCRPGNNPLNPPHGMLPETVDFNFHIKPILSDRCFKCHGPDKNTREANLRLDIKEGAFARLDSTKNIYAIVPGNLDKSVLARRIASTDPDFMMPPPESNVSLSTYEVELIRKWIGQGAEWKEHWSFIPPVKGQLPKVAMKSWPINEIDHFTLKRMDLAGLRPTSPASKEKWLRRVSFDLTGLPPAMDEIEDFLEDEGKGAYERVVERLLAAPAYGERMASVWLDAARYADSHGYQDDRPRTMWPWRDWVIDAFNDNMPYDTFVIWQLAGDLLPDTGYLQKLATGFNRNHAITQEGGVVNEEYITEYVADRTNTTATAFLGLTVECARCHDHKFDPISQKDYYRFFAFFNGIDERGQINYFDEAPVPNMPVEDEELEAIIAFVNSRIDSLEKKETRLNSPDNPDFQKWLQSQSMPNHLALDLSKGLLSHLRLDEVYDLETTDEVLARAPARMNTGLQKELIPPAQKTGWVGKALEFDGSNFLNLGDVGDFEWYAPFSIGTWIWSPGPAKKDRGLLVRRNGEQKRGGYELVLTADGHLRMSLIHNQGAEQVVVISNTRIESQKWIHVLATYDGSGRAGGIRLFINGQSKDLEIIEDKLLRKSILNGNDLLAGNWNHRNKKRQDIQGFAGGRLDEIRIYDRELSALEVEFLARPSDPALVNSGEVDVNQTDPARLLLFFLQNISPAYHQLLADLMEYRRSVQTVPNVMIMEEMDTIRPTYVLNRGAYDAHGEKVEPGPPSSILVFSDLLPGNRLGLAQWITDPQNPLTARVMVNRLWLQMFGKGIVETVEDFGNQGALPTHPELLDWLAVDFVESGWDIKAMLRKIALSATYRQSSSIIPEKRRIDPENRWLARGPNTRLSAEMIRDNALTVSGLLNDRVGGKWVKPYQPPGLWKELANQIGENKYRAGRGSELYRRSLYSYWKRTIPPPTMLTFDAAERSVCVVKRQSTTTPLQSLVLLNDPQYVEASRGLAMRMLESADDGEESGLRLGFQAVTSRSPTNEELAILKSLLKKEQTSFTADPVKAGRYISIGQLSYYPSVEGDGDRVALAAWTVVANTLLNLDEAKMKS